jgi:hypothetical protein
MFASQFRRSYETPGSQLLKVFQQNMEEISPFGQGKTGCVLLMRSAARRLKLE